MKKVLLLLTFVFCYTVGFSQDYELENAILQEELATQIELKEHYKKMAVYSEKDKELALQEVANYKEHTMNLYKNLEDSRDIADQFQLMNNENIIRLAKSQSHYEQVLAGYENQLMERVEQSRIDQIEIDSLRTIKAQYEDRIATTNNYVALLVFGILICCILYFIQGIILRRKPRKPSTEAVPLEVVPKKDSPATTRKTPKKEKSPKKEEVTVEEKKEEVLTTRYSLWLDKRQASRDIKRKEKLDRRRAKFLEQQNTDVVETDNRIKENNTNLALGVMRNFIFTVIGKPIPKTEEEKVEPVKEQPKPKNKPKNTTKGSTKTKGAEGGKGNKKPVASSTKKK